MILAKLYISIAHHHAGGVCRAGQQATVAPANASSCGTHRPRVSEKPKDEPDITPVKCPQKSQRSMLGFAEAIPIPVMRDHSPKGMPCVWVVSDFDTEAVVAGFPSSVTRCVHHLHPDWSSFSMPPDLVNLRAMVRSKRPRSSGFMGQNNMFHVRIAIDPEGMMS